MEIVFLQTIKSLTVTTVLNKTLGRVQDPHANGAWLSKLTEGNINVRRAENRSEEQEGMVERFGEIMKGRREMIEKGSRERIEKRERNKNLKIRRA